jgi:hypothetical protein
MDRRWWGSFSPSISVFSTNKTDRHDITEILLKVALNTIILTLTHIFHIPGKWTNGQSRETGNIGYTRRRQTKQKTQHDMYWKPLYTNKYIHIMHVKQTIPMLFVFRCLQHPIGQRVLKYLRYSLTFMQYACKASDCPDLSKSNLYNNNLIHDNMHFTFLLQI